MTPTAAYRRLNKLLWLNRLPTAIVVRVTNATLPQCYGVTIHDELCVRPVILLNSSYKHWGKTLMHEIVHVAEPSMPHGVLFDLLVEFYWKKAKSTIRGLK